VQNGRDSNRAGKPPIPRHSGGVNRVNRTSDSPRVKRRRRPHLLPVRFSFIQSSLSRRSHSNLDCGKESPSRKVIAPLNCDERHQLPLFSRFFHLQQLHIPKKLPDSNRLSRVNATHVNSLRQPLLARVKLLILCACRASRPHKTCPGSLDANPCDEVWFFHGLSRGPEVFFKSPKFRCTTIYQKGNFYD
jgi:hypothetical protein